MGNEEFWRYIIFPLMAAFGGAVNYSRRAYSMGKFTKIEFAIEAVSAAFVGLMITLAGSALDLSPHWLGMAAGMSGWMGADFVRGIFTEFVNTKIGEIKRRESKGRDNDN